MVGWLDGRGAKGGGSIRKAKEGAGEYRVGGLVGRWVGNSERERRGRAKCHVRGMQGVVQRRGRDVCATRMREKGELLSETRPQISQKHSESVWEQVRLGH